MDGCLHDLHHLLSNELLVGSFGVASGFNLSSGSLGESNGKHSEDVAVGSLGLYKCLNE